MHSTAHLRTGSFGTKIRLERLLYPINVVGVDEKILALEYWNSFAFFIEQTLFTQGYRSKLPGLVCSPRCQCTSFPSTSLDAQHGSVCSVCAVWKWDSSNAVNDSNLRGLTPIGAESSALVSCSFVQRLSSPRYSPIGGYSCYGRSKSLSAGSNPFLIAP